MPLQISKNTAEKRVLRWKTLILPQASCRLLKVEFFVPVKWHSLLFSFFPPPPTGVSEQRSAYLGVFISGEMSLAGERKNNASILGRRACPHVHAHKTILTHFYWEKIIPTARTILCSDTVPRILAGGKGRIKGLAKRKGRLARGTVKFCRRKKRNVRNKME